MSIFSRYLRTKYGRWIPGPTLESKLSSLEFFFFCLVAILIGDPETTLLIKMPSLRASGNSTPSAAQSC